MNFLSPKVAEITYLGGKSKCGKRATFGAIEAVFT
jgi:hypothetical protein